MRGHKSLVQHNVAFVCLFIIWTLNQMCAPFDGCLKYTAFDFCYAAAFHIFKYRSFSLWTFSIVHSYFQVR